MRISRTGLLVSKDLEKDIFAQEIKAITADIMPTGRIRNAHLSGDGIKNMDKEPTKVKTIGFVQCGICDFKTGDSNEMIKHFIIKHPKEVQVSILDDIKNSKETQDKLKVTISKDGEIIEMPECTGSGGPQTEE